MSKTSVGQKGEGIAAKYLIENGHEIIVKNFRLKGGEIDLVTLSKGNLYIYEVKFRQNLEYGFGDDAITPSKVRKIKNTFEIWLSQNENKYEFKNIYFNAIIIDPDYSIHEFEVM